MKRNVIRDFYFSVTFEDGAKIYHDNLSHAQARLRYHKWVREMSMQDIKKVAYGKMQ